MLNLPEQLLVLAFHEGKAYVLNTSLRFGLIGAILAELLIQGRIERNGLNLVCRDVRATSDTVLSDVLTLMHAFGGERRAKNWVQLLSSRLKRLQPRLMSQLVAKGAFRVENRRALGLFPYRRYHPASPHLALGLKDEIRQVVFRPFAPTPRQAALISLIKPAGLKVFSREERGAAKERIAELVGSDPIGRAVAGAVADAAAITAIIAASVEASG